MNRKETTMDMLDLVDRPGFCVRDNLILKANQAARSVLIREGAAATEFITVGQDEYSLFREGCLYLTLVIAGREYGASVTRIGDLDVFLLEQDEDRRELQAMALAARELRESLSTVMVTADRLLPILATQEDSTAQDQAARMNRGLFRVLRVISNMSDAQRYQSGSCCRKEIVDLRTVISDIFDRAAALFAHTGVVLSFTNLPDPVFSLADSDQLERAIWNILSNAIKFTPRGGTVEAQLTRRDRKLYLSVRDSGQGIPQELRSTIHSRYLRQPGLEDSRFGIGLGMVLIRGVASAHGGTVLIDHPENTGTRVTLTLALQQDSGNTLRSPALRVDYSGERDHGLLELSDALPAFLYENN